MKQFPDKINFKFPWRKYQERVLNELNEHLEDNHLHLIAPPGSGKTILGLEVALRVNKPTLILAPTNAIKNQWVSRFCSLFLQTEKVPEWISTDINNPSFLTVSTYQGLHYSFTQIESKEKLISSFNQLNLGSIVIDEAHHLKNSWWETLNELKNIFNPTIIGLTATPPYDVSYTEWDRYIKLNGAVDAEITVPELIKEGNLCPHQDFIYYSRPTTEENLKIDEYRSKIRSVYKRLSKDELLISEIENLAIYKNPEENIEHIYAHIEAYCSVLIFLNENGKSISEIHLEITGNKKLTLPKLSYDWLEKLLNYYLFNKADLKSEKNNKHFNLILKKAGVLEKDKVSLKHNNTVNKHLKQSISKLQSIANIVGFEYQNLKENLRLVILSDYIRDEFLPSEQNENIELNKMGVIPIFEKIRKNKKDNRKIGVLTGSIIIIPTSVLEDLNNILSSNSIEPFKTKPIYNCSDYIIITVPNNLKHKSVEIITELFSKGKIEILIGTKSLLGEGWDAPAINSLILASFVGSFVLSNQMRGRAIRTNLLDKNKTSTIWHLACIDPTCEDGGEDILMLNRRFKSFVGISNDEQTNIESGIERLNTNLNLISFKEIENQNNSTLKQATDRNNIKQKWDDALINGSQLLEEIKIPFNEKTEYNYTKKLYYSKTLKNVFGVFLSASFSFGFQILKGIPQIIRYLNNKQELIYLLLILGGSSTVYFLKQSYKTLRLYLKYRDISKDIQNVGEALLKTLIDLKIIKEENKDLLVLSQTDIKGTIFCHLQGGSTFDKSIFLKSLQELISTINNPRYIIVRRSKLFFIKTQKDYHSVPEIIGKKKINVEKFKLNWEKTVGKCNTIYTRTIEGRKLLLKYRVNSLSSEFDQKSERINKWR